MYNLDYFQIDNESDEVSLDDEGSANANDIDAHDDTGALEISNEDATPLIFSTSPFRSIQSSTGSSSIISSGVNRASDNRYKL